MKRPSGIRTVAVPGFRFAGISSGIKSSGDKDLALIISQVPSVTTGLFTRNSIKAAPVNLTMKHIAAKKKCCAIIVNSGNANACTGKQGLKDAELMVQTTADTLGIDSDLVNIASTGIIGIPLPMQKIKKAIPDLVSGLADSSLSDTADAIMTTDTFPKVAMKKITIGRATGTIAGIAKGAGMICPDMATMLCFMFTDISVHHSTLHFALQNAVSKSFNMLSVDNDMSTNDTVMLMSNGILGNTPLKKGSRFYNKFEQSLSELTNDLSRMIAEDGEGATKLIEIIIKGAKTDSDAEKVAKAVSTSMLVKTAIYGKDPNWGRIMAAVGYSNAKIIEQKINISINNVKLVGKGVGTGNDKIAKKVLAKKDITITIDLGMGKKTSKSLTCDLTDGYIRINAAYRT